MIVLDTTVLVYAVGVGYVDPATPGLLDVVGGRSA